VDFSALLIIQNRNNITHLQLHYLIIGNNCDEM